MLKNKKAKVKNENNNKPINRPYNDKTKVFLTNKLAIVWLIINSGITTTKKFTTIIVVKYKKLHKKNE
ncbi:hypothetical protein SCLARK_00875 [Spiroplasma clarkii]|nr:hypothetical protein SCLARK_00875 [Spiroplasma clarkii]